MSSPQIPVGQQQRTIVLIGPMGCGKSTVGAALARRLSRPHVDTDQFFVARNGPIPEYFRAKGEEAFRLEEEAIVAELLDAPRPSVVSLGGGSILSESTRELLAAHYVVMLEITEEQAAERLGDGSSRPILSGDPMGIWRQLRSDRDPLYRACADMVVDAQEATISARVDTIEDAINQQ